MSDTYSQADAQAETAAQRAKQKADDVASAVKEGASHAVETVKEKGAEALEEVKATAVEQVDRVKNFALQAADQRRTHLAGKLNEYQRAAHAAASKLSEEDDTVLSKQIDRFAGMLAEVSSYFSNRDMPALARDLGKFTRKHPEVLIGGTILAGFALARFLKTSSHRSS